MPGFRHCSSCRALVVESEQIATLGTCPYCRSPLGPTSEEGPRPGDEPKPDDEPEDPYTPPQASLVPEPEPEPGRWGRFSVRSVRDRLNVGVFLLLEQLPLFTALVFTVWLPGNLLIELAVSGAANPSRADVWQMSNIVNLCFGPIVVGGIVTALANRMYGERTTYPAAIQAGFHHWGRLFIARLVSAVLITLGFLALIVPGMVLAVRFSLIDDVLVLEGVGVRESLRRSTALARGRAVPIVLAMAGAVLLVFIAMVITSPLLLWLMESTGDPLFSAICGCVPHLFGVLFTCVLFQFYWEAVLPDVGEKEWIPGVGFRDNEE